MLSKAGARIALLAALLLACPVLAQAQEPSFEVQGDRDQAPLAFTIQGGTNQTTEWSRTLFLTVRSKAEQPTKGLQIVSPITLETPGHAAAEISAEQPGDKTLQPGGRLAFTLKGKFPAPGVYSGQIRLVKDGVQKTTALKVTVTGPLPVQEHGGQTLALTGDERAILVLRLRNTGDEPLSGVSASVAGVALLDKADKPTWRLALPESAGALNPGPPPSDDAGPADLGQPPRDTAAQAPGQTSRDAAGITNQRLQQGEVGRFTVTLTGLAEPGVYFVETLVREGSGAYHPHLIQTLVYRREPWCNAALAILLGAFVAALVRWHVSDGEKRFALRRRIALLLENIRAFQHEEHGAAAVAAARVLEVDVADRLRYVRWGGKIEDLNAIIGRAEVRLGLLRECAEALDQLKRIDADRQQQARMVVDRALRAVRTDAGDDESLKQQRKAIDDLALHHLEREQLRTRLTELKTQFSLQRKTGSTQLRTMLHGLDLGLARAEAALREDRLPDLHRALDEAQGALIDACAEDLARLAQNNTPPPFIDADEWSVSAQAIHQALNPQSAAHLESPAAHPQRPARTLQQRHDDLIAAQRIYFKTAVGGLIRQARNKINEHDSRNVEFTKLATDLQMAVDKNIDQAAQLYPDALAMISAPDPARASRAQVGRDTGTVGVAPLRLSLRGQTPLPGTGGLDSTAIHRSLTSLSWLINALVLGLALCSGVKTLWLNDLAWGGGGAWLAAFLWGAGVQAGGEALASLATVRARLGGVASVS